MKFLFPNLLEDLDIYAYRKGWPKWTWFLMPMFYWTTWPIIEYRFNNWLYYKVKIPVIRQILRLICFFWHRIVCTFLTVEISERAHIGKGIFIAHFGNIVISHGAKVGNFMSIHQGVTLGGAGRREDYGDPIIGDNVYIGAGAKILGKIALGDNVMVGANAVVIHNIPDNSSIGGIPAKIINSKGSLDFVHYRSKSNPNVK